MNVLIRDDEEVITDEDSILQEIHAFYRDLYSREDLPTESAEEEAATLVTLDKKLEEQDNDKLRTEPDMEEIRTIVKNLTSDKSPGIDGVTAEVIRECWEWIEEGCLALIQHFWITGAQLNLAKSAVIPLHLPEVPQWLLDSGCKVVKPGEHIIYLGCRAGVQLTEEEHTQPPYTAYLRMIAV
ncbi:hypothetical protein R1sor_005043 [Riccia sorocarpa]|uniref:Uncharacterized protein n=1 Tax=Riccia sorocarpa TaxID=122646 RepID=A0ABD3HLW8_9MARC